MLAFQREAWAIGRLMLIPLDRVSVTVNGLKQFDVANATCYSPFDQFRLMQIIDAVGRNEFNAKVRKVGERFEEQQLTYP